MTRNYDLSPTRPEEDIFNDCLTKYDMKEIQGLAYYWLSTDCNLGNMCNGMDLNGDSIVNFVDFALLQRIEVEFISQ